MNSSLFLTFWIPIPLALKGTYSFLLLAILHLSVSCLTEISTLSHGFSSCSEVPCLNAFSKKGNINNGAINLSLTSPSTCLLYTSDAADERSSVDLGGR